MGRLFYNLGKKIGPKYRKAKWVWQSISATETEIIKAEYEVGQDLASEVRKRLELDKDPQAEQILSEVGSKLSSCVANKLRSFRFEVIIDDQPNAFALPGGFIFVTSSLLELCRWNADQIAFVLAHEMAHVIRGHAIDRIITNSAIKLY